MAKEVKLNIKGAVDLDVSGLLSKLSATQKGLSKLGGPESKRLDSLFTKAITELKEFETASKRTFGSVTEVNTAVKAYDKMAETLKRIGIIMDSDSFKGDLGFSEAAKRGKAALENFQKQTKTTFGQIEKISKELGKDGIKVDTKALVEAAKNGKSFGNFLGGIRREAEKLAKAPPPVSDKGYKEAIVAAKEYSKEIENSVKQRNAVESSLGIAEKNIKVFENIQNRSKQEEKDLEDAKRKAEALRRTYDDYSKSIENSTEKLGQQQKIIGEYDAHKVSVESAKEHLKQIEEVKESYAQLSSTARSISFEEILGKDIAARFKDVEQNAEGLQEVLNRLDEEQVAAVAEHVKGLKKNFEEVNKEATGLEDLPNKWKQQADEILSVSNQVESLHNKMLHFFTLTNGWLLLRNAMRSAYNTVKELDDAMTEIAVVSDYTLDQVWAMRSGYSDAATKMGAATIDLVDATKLYVQQGLDLQEAQEVGIETIKMARIANLDGAEATNLMTAAIRGFHMELSQANEVNDVYSELAAKSAADTREIATAMSKTASIAASAGAEFSNISTFLTQIIETTREAPETAGTALKTIIARFQELKKPLSEIGEVEGEVVDANRIETALRQAGVALRNTKGEFRDFDDVIIELSSKWDTLDVMTQRYIATMAAGARQQSRFIALVADNARLTELLGYANNSAGASAKQFEKTLDSLEAKISKMNNAIDIFYTNLANNEIIKFMVEAVTALVDVINKVVGVFSELPGVTGDLAGMGATILLAFGAFKLATAIINAFFGNMAKQFVKAKGTVGKESQDLGNKAAEGFEKSMPRITKAVRDEMKKVANEFKGGDRTFESFINAAKKVPPAMQKQFSGKMKPIVNTMAKEWKEGVDASKFDETTRKVAKQAIDAFAEELKNTGSVEEARVALAIELEKLGKEAGDKMEEHLLTMGMGESTYKAINSQFSVMSSAVGNLGSVFMSMGSALQSTGNPALEKLGSVLSSAGSVLSSVSSGISSFIALLVPMKTATLGQAGATGVATKAQWSLNAAFLACPVFWIIAGIAALIAIFWGLSKIIETDAEKMNKLNKTLDELKNEADEAKQALSDIASQKEGLASLEDTLDGLTKGTQAWRSALVDVNQKVLELISKYPALAEGIKNVDGQLILSEAAWDGVAKTQTDQYTSALNAQIAVQQQKQNLQASMDMKKFRLETEPRSNLMADTRRTQIGIATLGFSELDSWLSELITGESINDRRKTIAAYQATRVSNEDYLKFAEEMGKAGLRSGDEGALETLFGDMVKSGEISGNFAPFYQELKSAGEALDKFAQEAHAATLAKEAERDALIANLAVQSEALHGVGMEEWSKLAIAGADRMFDDFDEKIEQQIKEDGYGKIDDDLKREYSDATGKTLDEINKAIEEKSLSLDTMKTTVASKKVTDQMSEGMEAIAETYQKMGEDDAKYFKAIASHEGEDLTQDLIDGFTAGLTGGELSVDSLNERLKELGKTAEDLGFTDSQQMLEVINTAQEALKQVWEDMKGIGVEAGDNFKKLSLDAAQGLSEGLHQVFDASGKEGAAQMAELIDAAIGKVGPENAEKFVETLNSIDWKDTDSIKGLKDKLKELNIDIKDINFDDFESQLISLAKASREIDLEKLAEQIRNLSNIVFKIGAGEQTRQFSSSDYDNLVEVMPEIKGDFTYNLETDTFDYIGTSMDKLAIAIVANTNAILGQTGLEQKIKSGEAIEKMMSTDGTSYSKAFTGDANAMVQWLTSYISQAGEDAGISQEAVSKWGQAGNTEQLQAMMNMVYENYVNLKDNTAKLNEVAVEGLAAASQVQGPVVTSQLASQARESGDTEAVDAYTKALRAQAIAAGVAEDVLENYAKALESQDSSQIEAAETALANATAIKQQEKALTKTLDTWEDSIKTMEEYEEGSFGYNQALEQIAETLGMEIDDPFLQVADNLDLIKEGANGNTQALIDLQNKLAEYYGFTIDGQGNFDPTPMIEGLDSGQEKAIALTNQLLQAGQFVIVEEDMVAGQFYQVPRIDHSMGFPIITGFDTVRGETGGKVPVVKPASAPTIDKVQTGRGSGTGKKSDKKGGGEGKKEELYKNEYDWLYNLLEKTNEAIRQRNRLESDYDRMLKRRKASSLDLYKNMQDQLTNLKEQQKYFDEQMRGRMKEQADIEKEYKDVRQYANYNEVLGYVEIDWDAINKVTKQETGDRIDEYISKLEDVAGKIDEVDDSLYDIIDQIDAIYELGKQEYMDFETRVHDALMSAQQAVVDGLSNVNDAINNSNSKLLDKLQKSIDETRKIRDNQEKEDDIAKKERRLAFLRQDTSGANQMEILQLEEELAQDRQDYTDTLIDDKINELQMQNDAAAEQREQQIEIMQAQLDSAIEQGILWADVHSLISEGVGGQGQLVKGSDLERLLQSEEGFSGLSQIGKMEWLSDLEIMIAEGIAFLSMSRQLEDIGKKSGKITFTDSAGKVFTGTVDSKGNVTTSDGKVFKDVYQMYDGSYRTLETGSAIKAPTPAPAPTSPTPSSPPKETYYTVKKGDNLSKIAKEFNKQGYKTSADKIAKDNKIKNKNLIYPGQRFLIKKYKKGGLIDYTGPAWVDGTTRDPELMLNAQDTKNFIALKDVLEGLRNSGGVNNSFGDNLFDIRIMVDEISSDYDVDQLVRRVKKDILEDSQFRNINAVGGRR